KFHFVDAAETDEAFPADISASVKAGELRAGLDHQHAGEQRAAGDVAGNPEFVGTDILVANDQPIFGFGPDDAVELFHVAALGIGGTDRLLIEEQGFEVDGGDVKEVFGGHVSDLTT